MMSRAQDGLVMLLSGQADHRRQLLTKAEELVLDKVNMLTARDTEIRLLQSEMAGLKNNLRGYAGEVNLLKYQLQKSKKSQQITHSISTSDLSTSTRVQKSNGPSSPSRQAWLLHNRKSQSIFHELIAKTSDGSNKDQQDAINGDVDIDIGSDLDESFDLTAAFSCQSLTQDYGSASIALPDDYSTSQVMCDDHDIESTCYSNELSTFMQENWSALATSDPVTVEVPEGDMAQLKQQLEHQIKVNERLKEQIRLWVDAQMNFHQRLGRQSTSVKDDLELNIFDSNILISRDSGPPFLQITNDLHSSSSMFHVSEEAVSQNCCSHNTTETEIKSNTQDMIDALLTLSLAVQDTDLDSDADAESESVADKSIVLSSYCTMNNTGIEGSALIPWFNDSHSGHFMQTVSAMKTPKPSTSTSTATVGQQGNTVTDILSMAKEKPSPRLMLALFDGFTSAPSLIPTSSTVKLENKSTPTHVADTAAVSNTTTPFYQQQKTNSTANQIPPLVKSTPQGKKAVIRAITRPLVSSSAFNSSDSIDCKIHSSGSPSITDVKCFKALFSSLPPDFTSTPEKSFHRRSRPMEIIGQPSSAELMRIRPTESSCTNHFEETNKVSPKSLYFSSPAKCDAAPLRRQALSKNFITSNSRDHSLHKTHFQTNFSSRIVPGKENNGFRSTPIPQPSYSRQLL